MNRKDLKVGRVYEDTARVGRRIITMLHPDMVYFIVVRQGIGNGARPMGGGHISVRAFVTWADREVRR